MQPIHVRLTFEGQYVSRVFAAWEKPTVEDRVKETVGAMELTGD